jgi:hypothetical protein
LTSLHCSCNVSLARWSYSLLTSESETAI